MCIKNKTNNDQLIEHINQEWISGLIAEGINNIMVYKPFSERYWEERFKICVINIENYGYQNSGVTAVDKKVYEMWLSKKNKTCKNTAVFTHGLLKTLDISINRETTIVKKKHLRQFFQNNSLLIDSMIRVVYTNFRKEPNNKAKENTKAILKEVKKFSDFHRRYLDALKPNIILISGKTGVKAYNLIASDEKKLKYNGYVKIENCFIFSVAHFSRISYSYMIDKFQEISNLIS